MYMFEHNDVLVVKCNDSNYPFNPDFTWTDIPIKDGAIGWV